METLTNILDYQINREAIDKDFCVVCFRFEDKLNPRVLDNPEVNVKSIYYTKCKAYALMHHDDYDNLYYCDELKKNNITYEKMNINDVFDPVLIQLFLNTLTNLAGNYNNLTGKYCKMLSKDNDKSTKIKNTKRKIWHFSWMQ